MRVPCLVTRGDREAINSASKAAAVNGLEKWKPCAFLQPIMRSASACVALSTPSAMTERSSDLAMAITAFTSAVSYASPGRPATKDRSIFKVSIGNLLRRDRDE